MNNPTGQALSVFGVQQFMDKEIEIEQPERQGFVEEVISRAQSAIAFHETTFPNNRDGIVPALAHRACLQAEGVTSELENKAFELLLSLDAEYDNFAAYLLDTARYMSLDKRVDLTPFKQIESRLLETADAQSAKRWLMEFPLVCRYDDLLEHVKAHMHPSVLEDALVDIEQRYKQNDPLSEKVVQSNQPLM